MQLLTDWQTVNRKIGIAKRRFEYFKLDGKSGRKLSQMTPLPVDVKMPDLNFFNDFVESVMDLESNLRNVFIYKEMRLTKKEEDKFLP